MREKIKFIYILLIVLPLYAHADTASIDAATNASIIENKIKLNEAEFNKVAEQIAKRYPNFDWVTFDNFDFKTKRMILKNYLARLAFEEVKENYLKDIRARAKEGVSTEKHGEETYYFNKSDAKYRTQYITDQMIQEKAKKHNILHAVCDDCSMGYVKQKDVKILDEILKQEIANAPVEMYCEKYCFVYNQAQADIDEQFLAKIRDYMQSYQEIQKQYLSEMKKSGAPRQKVKEERKKIAYEMRELEQNYNDWVQVLKAHKEWSVDPYTENCEMVSASCWNVEKIPQNYERFELRTDDYSDDGIIQVHYEYDDIANNTHTEADAWRNCNCESDINDVKTYVNCDCDISFFDEIQDFAAVRKWENQDRVDIKNGKMQDRDENGVYKHEWAGNRIPGGKVVGRTLNLSGTLEKTVTKSITK